MKELVNRPASIWLAQIILALQAINFLGLISLRAVFSNQAIIPVEFLVFAVLLGLLPLAAFIALTMRARIGRELAILSILCLWGSCIRGLGIVTIGTTLLLFAIACLPVLVFKLGFGKKAAEFFSRA